MEQNPPHSGAEPPIACPRSEARGGPDGAPSVLLCDPEGKTPLDMKDLSTANPVAPERADPAGPVRARLAIRGLVQGVGFRPFVFQLATQLGLGGWVANSPQGVFVEIEGHPSHIRQFLLRLDPERPAHSCIQSLETTYLDPIGFHRFEIRPSNTQGERAALVLPDIATCPTCLREVFDPQNRRHNYPFTNCTHCGPRYSILRALPYDRPNTSMSGFALCPACRAEYDDPRDRRFHAQPNACPVCGPHIELWRPDGSAIHTHHDALIEAARAVRAGAVVAVKSLGGFHLVVLAADDLAVRRLRERKGREAKPFALLFQSIDQVRQVCAVTPLEDRLLRSAEAPIVLLRRHRGRSGGEAEVAPAVAPDNPCLGVMLPNTPLHHLLMAEVGGPVVATSGNRSDEPLCTDEREALDRLGGIADLFLVHNRPIVRHVDDSMVRVVLDRELVLRRARGYAPLPIAVRDPLPPVLAVGAHLKNTAALAHGRHVFLSQHIGDLETPAAHAAFQRVVHDLPALFNVRPALYAADAHPDYLSTQWARASGRPVLAVQHHYAHTLACMAENDVDPPLLGVSWDGTGLGIDRTIWGGEFLRITAHGFERAGHLRCFCLPGGDKAAQEPRRAAIGLLHALLGDAAFANTNLASVAAFTATELKGIRQMLERQVNTPTTSSAGRLFDAVASLLGLRQKAGFEGQAALDLEFALEDAQTDAAYPIHIRQPTALASRAAAAPGAGCTPPGPLHGAPDTPNDPPPRLVLDWAPMIQGILDDLRLQTPVCQISARFHNTLAEGILAAARLAGERRVVLSGGCFQNRYLLEQTVRRLRVEGFSPYWHQRVPTNDGGIALGQVMAVARARTKLKR